MRHHNLSLIATVLMAALPAFASPLAAAHGDGRYIATLNDDGTKTITSFISWADLNLTSVEAPATLPETNSLRERDNNHCYGVNLDPTDMVNAWLCMNNWNNVAQTEPFHQTVYCSSGGVTAYVCDWQANTIPAGTIQNFETSVSVNCGSYGAGFVRKTNVNGFNDIEIGRVNTQGFCN